MKTFIFLFIFCGSVVFAQAPFIVEDWLSEGNSPNYLDGESGTILHRMAKTGVFLDEGECSEIIEILIAHGVFLDKVDHNGRTALMVAIKEKNLVLAKVIINAGAKVCLSDSEGDSTLHFASRIGDIDLIEMILERGASPSQRNEYGESPYEIVFFSGNEKAFKIMDFYIRRLF